MMINIRMQREHSLDNEGETLNRVGWFLPPFTSLCVRWVYPTSYAIHN